MICHSIRERGGQERLLWGTAGWVKVTKVQIENHLVGRRAEFISLDLQWRLMVQRLRQAGRQTLGSPVCPPQL